MVLPLRPEDELYKGHIRLTKETREAIAAGKTGRSYARVIEREVFEVLFGPDGCRELLSFCDGDCELAFSLISPDYDRKIMPKLRKRFQREKKRGEI